MSDALVTDLYEVTMALSYLRERMTDRATFSLFARRLPPDRGFLVAAGLEGVLDFLEQFEITDDDIGPLSRALGRSRAEADALRGLRFTGDVWAIPEGRIVLANEPLLEITAALPQAQLVETRVLNQINIQTVLASKAARCVLAAQGKTVIDFSLRRTHGIQAGMLAARAAAIVGFAGTSNVAGALRYGLPAVGTMAHSYIESFSDERAAFDAFAASTDGPVTLLVDTYDTEAGVKVAAQALRAQGPRPMSGIRLDSGDLATLARRSRQILDAAGLAEVRIIASGGLDEYAVHDLIAAGAPIDTFAVGTKVGTSADAPYLDSAYKLVEYSDHPVMKLSPGKLTLPGAKQVFRRPPLVDLISLRDEPGPPDSEPLLELVMHQGRRVRPADGIEQARSRFTSDLGELPGGATLIRGPVPPIAATSTRLRDLSAELGRAEQR